MTFIGMITHQTAMENPDNASSGGIMAACFAPMAIYILIYGQVIHFFYLFMDPSRFYIFPIL
jgi:hypothetical protein